MIETLKKRITAQKRYIRLQELSNDSYYLSFEQKEDYAYLNSLYKELQTHLSPKKIIHKGGKKEV